MSLGDWLEERLFALRGLARKHQVSVAELPALQKRMAAQLARIELAEHRTHQDRVYPVGESTLPDDRNCPVIIRPVREHELPGHSFDSPGAVFILAPDLLEQLHFLPPVQPASVPDPSGSGTEYPGFEQGGQIRVSKWANSE